MRKSDDQNQGGTNDSADETQLNKLDWAHDQNSIQGSRRSSPNEQERPISDTVEPPEE